MSAALCPLCGGSDCREPSHLYYKSFYGNTTQSTVPHPSEPTDSLATEKTRAEYLTEQQKIELPSSIQKMMKRLEKELDKYFALEDVLVDLRVCKRCFKCKTHKNQILVALKPLKKKAADAVV